MATSGTPYPKRQQSVSQPLSYSEYAQSVLKDLPPDPVLPGQIANNENKLINANTKNPSNPRSNEIGNKSILNGKLEAQNLTVVVNVTGTRFEISRATYSKLEPAILDSRDPTLVQINQQTGCPEIFVERNSVCFAAILDYYRCGELHMPSDICPSVFKRELTYWRLESCLMESCCLRKYAAFHSNEQTLSSCHKTFTQWKDATAVHSTTRWGRMKRKGWAVMDDPKSGPLAKIYLCVASFFVVLSIFLLAASTDSHFKRDLNSDEWEEFMSYDELYTYWDRIYPGKPKPEFDQPVDPMTPGFPMASSTQSPPVGNNPVPVPGVGRRKRSATDVPNEASQIVKDDINKILKDERVTGRLKPTIDFKQQMGETDEAFLLDQRVDEGEESSDKLSHLVLEGIRKAMKEFTKDPKSPKNIKRMTQKIVRDVHGKKLEGSVRRTAKETGEYHDSTDFQNHDDYVDILQKLEQENTPDDFPDEYSAGFEPQPPPTNTRLNGRVVGRVKRSTGQNVNNNTNGLSGGWNMTELLNAECVYLSGSVINDLIAEAVLFSAVASSDYNYDSETLPTASTVYRWVDILETICMAYFTLEFLLRLLLAPSLFGFLFSFLTMMDLVSLATMYISATVQFLLPELKYKESAMDAVNCLQIARVFRFFRLVKDVIGFRVLLLSVRTSWRELLLLLLYIMMAVTIFATVVFFCERENMKSIPEAAWWAIVTMTTVGYGDMTPKTLQGRLTGMACAMSGVLLIAVTVPIFVNNFILFYEYSKISMDSEFYKDLNKANEKRTTTTTTTRSGNKNSTENIEGNTRNKNTGKRQSPRSNSTVPTGKLFQQSSSDSNMSNDIGLEPVTSPPCSPSSWDSTTSGNEPPFSRTSSSKSLISRAPTANSSTGIRSPFDNSARNPEVISVASASKVTPFVYDLELEQDNKGVGTNVKAASGNKSQFGRNRKANKPGTSLA